MKSPAYLLTLLSLVSLLAAACRSKDSAKEAAPSAQPPVVASIAKAPARPIEPLPTPTELDFEEDVSQRITSKNLEAELDRLEKELQAP